MREVHGAGGGIDPHSPFGPADFKSAASANFAIPASDSLSAVSHSRGIKLASDANGNCRRHTLPILKVAPMGH